MKIETEREFDASEQAFIQRLARNAADYYLTHWTSSERENAKLNPEALAAIAEALLVVLGDTEVISFLPDAWAAGVGFGEGSDHDADYIPPGGAVRWPAEDDAATCVRQLASLEVVARVLKRYFVEWMLDNDVPQVRVAKALGTSPQNVHRNYRARPWQCREVVAAALDEERSA